jgi:hypothetical protein
MANPWTGEVALTVDGERRVLKLTLGALAELEARLEADSLMDLVGRFETGRFSARDVIAVLVAGLRGGGHEGVDLAGAEIAGGPMEAARVAGQLVVRAFTLPEAGA